VLLARMAEAMYWAGRYLERAEGVARIVQVHGDTHVDLPLGEDVGWEPLLAVTEVRAAFDERHRAMGTPRSATPPAPAAPAEAQVIEFVLADRDNPSSILSSIIGARDNLRTARPVVPRQVWELANDLLAVSGAQVVDTRTRDGRVRWLRHVVAECERANGVLWGTMRRDEAMAFVRMGQYLERAQLTCRVLDVRAESAVDGDGGDPYDDVRWAALLRSLAAYQPFRRAMPTRPGGGSTLRFLLQDAAFPRSVSACLGELLALVKTLPRNEPVLAACADAAVVAADAPVPQVTAADLRDVVGGLGAALCAVHDHVDATYFRAPSAEAVALDPGRAARTQPRGSAMETGELGRIGTMAGSKTYRVTHRTTYTYDAPVEQSYNEAHLRPRDTERQRCLTHDIAVDPPPATWSEYDDLFGNRVCAFVVRGGFDSLSVTSTSEVVVSSPPAPPASPPWESVRMLLDIDRQLSARDARRYRASSRLIPMAGALGDYAAPSFSPGRPLVDAVVDLTARIHRDFAYEPGFTSVTTPVLEVLDHRRGVCQDFAHLAVGCLRTVGLAARYVSGYIETVPPPGAPRLVGADASHAWASLYLPGWGWLDVDPTNDQLVSDAYVTVAWGRDYWDVSPLRGSVEGGGASHRLEVAVDVDHVATDQQTLAG